MQETTVALLLKTSTCLGYSNNFISLRNNLGVLSCHVHCFLKQPSELGLDSQCSDQKLPPERDTKL